MQGNINVHHTLQILGSLLVIRAMSSALLKHHTVLVFVETPPTVSKPEEGTSGHLPFFSPFVRLSTKIHSQGSDCQCRVPQVTSGHNRTFGPTSHFHYAIMPCCARSQHTEEAVFTHCPCYLRDLASQNEIQVVVLLQWT